jgi:hypothetical protein
MTFFHDLNKRLAELANKQDLHESKVAESEKWIQKAVNPANKGNLHKALHVAQGEKIPKAKIEKATHSKNPKLRHMAQFAKNVANEEMADEGNAFTGALAKTPKGGKFKVGGKEFTDTSSLEEGHCPTCDCSPCKCDSMEESALQAYLGKKKYGDKGMKALQQAGREHVGKAKMDQIRNRYDKMDEGEFAGHPAKYGVYVVGHNDGKPVKTFDNEADAKAYANKGVRIGGKLLQGSVSTIVGEGDMEEGNAFTAALAKTPKGSKFKVGGKEFTDTSDLEEGFKEMDAWLASREKEKGTGKFDRKERTLPSGMKATTYTRKHDDEEDSDNEVTSDAPKKKGRPKGPAKGPERVTKGAWKHKGARKEKTKEALDSDGVMMTRPTNCSSESIEHGEQAEYNDEAGMTKDSLHTIVRHAKELERALRSNENMPEWVQEKIGQIKGMMSSVTDYIISTHERDAEQRTGKEGITTVIPEKAVSKAQRKFMGMAHAIQKGEKIKGASPELKKVAKTMKPSDTHDFAATKEKGLPKKVKKTEEGAKPDFLDMDKDGNKKESMKKAVADKKEEKVDETTVAGSVATATPSGKSSSGGMQFGKGVYESFNNSVEKMITESIDVAETVAENEGEGKTITVTANGPEADMLMQLLKAAGLSGQNQGCGCGNTPCSCEELDENSPDWPTNTETLAAQPELRTYSGGLNGPKSTGQTTIPVVASQLRRQVSMEESVELERNLFKTWKNYKG